MSPSTSQVSSSLRRDGITVYKFPRVNSHRSVRYQKVHPDLWKYVESKKIYKHEGKKVLTNIYYCNNCTTVFVLPGWFTPYYKHPRRILERHMDCCSKKSIFYLIRADDMDEPESMIFEPFAPLNVWEIPDYWINAAVVADELL